MNFKEKLSEILQDVYLRVEKEPSIVEHAQDKILALIESDIVGEDEESGEELDMNKIVIGARNKLKQEQRSKLR